MTDRERLHDLVEDLPESEVHAALRFVEYLRHSEDDPVLTALRDAPPDDEPVTEEDIAALEEAWEDVRQGRVVSHEAARRCLLGEIETDRYVADLVAEVGPPSAAQRTHAAAVTRRLARRPTRQAG